MIELSALRAKAEPEPSEPFCSGMELQQWISLNTAQQNWGNLSTEEASEQKAGPTRAALMCIISAPMAPQEITWETLNRFKEHGCRRKHASTISTTHLGRPPQNCQIDFLCVFPSFRVRQKEFDHFSVFGTLSVTFRSPFLMLLSLFSSLFCQTPFAGLLLRQGDSWLVHHKRKSQSLTIWAFQSQIARNPTDTRSSAWKSPREIAIDFNDNCDLPTHPEAAILGHFLLLLLP